MNNNQPETGGEPDHPVPTRPRRSQRHNRPTHPPLAAALLMIGIVVFLVIVSMLSVL